MASSVVYWNRMKWNDCFNTFFYILLFGIKIWSQKGHSQNNQNSFHNKYEYYKYNHDYYTLTLLFECS